MLSSIFIHLRLAYSKCLSLPIQISHFLTLVIQCCIGIITLFQHQKWVITQVSLVYLSLKAY